MEFEFSSCITSAAFSGTLAESSTSYLVPLSRDSWAGPWGHGPRGQGWPRACSAWMCVSVSVIACTCVKEVGGSPLLFLSKFVAAAAYDSCGGTGCPGVAEIHVCPAATSLPSWSWAGRRILCWDLPEPPHQARLQVHSSSLESPCGSWGGRH